ncbi:hypothetical protein R3W88_019386 [Solanum pinnatisectum]|uniref:Uncharacterized protein n=1 Tax=Solanum pinnatisectum TaxID=50273 RepID=A0AAV9KLP3_9SOLN|nr:hypothetical protein R3W88_019386 [Solanum pinnatisectum]
MDRGIHRELGKWTSGSNKEKKQTKETHRTLIDEEDVDDFPLTIPQPSRDCASNENFEYFDLEDEDDIPWKPIGVSELKQINFLGDGPTAPSDLYAPKALTWKGNASTVGTLLEQLRVEILETKQGNDKAQQ